MVWYLTKATGKMNANGRLKNTNNGHNDNNNDNNNNNNNEFVYSALSRRSS